MASPSVPDSPLVLRGRAAWGRSEGLGSRDSKTEQLLSATITPPKKKPFSCDARASPPQVHAGPVSQGRIGPSGDQGRPRCNPLHPMWTPCNRTRANPLLFLSLVGLF